MSEVLLEAEGLRRSYLSRRNVLERAKRVQAVNGISLSIRRRETVGLVGESGSGKSTIGRLLLGMEAPDHGSVRFEGKPLPKTDSASWRRLRARMQMVFQDPLAALDRRLIVRRQIEEPLVVHGIARREERTRRSTELLDAVGLRREHGERYPHELSGGQRQRIVLARALATNPDLLVCDEPISALDVSIQAQIMNLLADLQEKFGTAILFISHDLRAVRQLSTRVAVIYLGEIVEEGPTDEILSKPLHPYTQALVSAVPDHNGLGRDRIVLEGEPPNPAERPSGCAFHPRCRAAVAACAKTAPVLTVLPGSGRKVACRPVYEKLHCGSALEGAA